MQWVNRNETLLKEIGLFSYSLSVKAKRKSSRPRLLFKDLYSHAKRNSRAIFPSGAEARPRGAVYCTGSAAVFVFGKRF